MGWIVLIFMLLVLLGILWIPSVVVLRKNKIRLWSVKVSALFLSQVLAVVVIVKAEDAFGLLNPAGLILVTTVMVAAVATAVPMNLLRSIEFFDSIMFVFCG